MENKHFIYILRCGDGSLYTGYTNNLEKRLKAHQSGKGAKYTAAHLPVNMIYTEIFDTKSEALKREYFIKNLKRSEKLKLIENKSL